MNPKNGGVSQNSGDLLGGPNHKDHGILGCILGSLYFGKLPSIVAMFYSFFPIHRQADNFVACTCFYIAENVEYSEAHFYWPG